MKSLKLILINVVTLMIALGIITSSTFQDAEAARFENVPALQAKNLKNYRGQYLTVFYVVGTKPFISTGEPTLSVKYVKASKTFYIASDIINVPPVRIAKEGFRPSYNMVLFVVSPNSNYSWINPDGSAPQGITLTRNHKQNLVQVFKKSDLEEVLHQQGEGPVALILGAH